MCAERFEHLGLNRVATWSDGWSNSNQEVGRVCSKLFPSRADDGPGNPFCRTTPAGMSGANYPAPPISKSDRHAICKGKEEIQAWDIADDPVTAETRLALPQLGSPTASRLRCLAVCRTMENGHFIPVRKTAGDHLVWRQAK